MIILCMAAMAQAADEPATWVRISAGATARRGTPVEAILKADLPAGDAELVSDGLVLPAQVETAGETCIVRWVEPNLGAGKSRTYALRRPAAASTQPALRHVDHDGYRDVLYGDSAICRYVTRFDPADRGETYRPFLHLFGLHGEGFVTKGPGGMETHHRGIFFGFQTPLGNFWACSDGVQKHTEYRAEREFTGPVAARDASVVDWIAKDGRPVIRDVRELTTWRPGDGQVVLDYTIEVRSLAGDVALAGNAHHGGLHFRAAQEVAGEKPSLRAGSMQFIRPAGATLTKDDQWADTPWVAATFTIHGNPYVVMQVDHPSNPRPTTFSTRPYGRFGAFFSGTLREGQPIQVRYRFILIDGKLNPSPEALASLAADFANPPTVKLGKAP